MYNFWGLGFVVGGWGLRVEGLRFGVEGRLFRVEGSGEPGMRSAAATAQFYGSGVYGLDLGVWG